jgi:hypothetical protein
MGNKHWMMNERGRVLVIPYWKKDWRKGMAGQIVHGPFASVRCMDDNALFAQGLGSGARLTRTVHIHKIFLTNLRRPVELWPVS